MSYKITAYRANGTARDWADVFDEDALRLLEFWDRGLRLPAFRQDMGQGRVKQTLLNRDAFEAIEVEATPLQFFAPTVDTGSVSSSLGCGVLATATMAGGLVDAQEE